MFDFVTTGCIHDEMQGKGISFILKILSGSVDCRRLAAVRPRHHLYTRRRQALRNRQGRVSHRYSPSVRRNHRQRGGNKRKFLHKTPSDNSDGLIWFSAVSGIFFCRVEFQSVHPPCPLFCTVGWIHLGRRRRKKRGIKYPIWSPQSSVHL